MIQVPAHFWSVPYNGDCFPGAPGAIGLSNGANCQHFAYELLRHFGKRVPNFRSKELWEDRDWTQLVSHFAPLDLLLYNSKDDPWGAHVGVFIDEGQIIHLSKEVGRAVVWTHDQFLTRPRYQHFLGGKRIRDNVTKEAEQSCPPNVRPVGPSVGGN